LRRETDRTNRAEQIIQAVRDLEPTIRARSGEINNPGTVLLLLLKGIGLTAEQKLQMKEILVTYRGKPESLFQELQAANTALTNILLAPDAIGDADVAPSAKRVSQIREQLLREGLTVVLEVRRVLTQEQRVKVA